MKWSNSSDNLEATITDQSSVNEEIKGRFKSRNAYYHSAQNLLYSSLLSKNIKIKIYRTVILFCMDVKRALFH